MTAHALMLSSSRQGDEAYLEHARPHILAHLGDIRDLLFVPYAAVTGTYDEYVNKVAEALPECNVTGLHTVEDPVSAINHAKENGQSIVVGGGNTFHLLSTLYAGALVVPIKHAIADATTNDMPIIEPPSFEALNVVPFQLNPHYTDYQPEGHNGETRDQRLFEFTALNPSTPVVAIREGTALTLTDSKLELAGDKEGYVFLGNEKSPIAPGADLTELLNREG